MYTGTQSFIQACLFHWLKIFGYFLKKMFIWWLKLFYQVVLIYRRVSCSLEIYSTSKYRHLSYPLESMGLSGNNFFVDNNVMFAFLGGRKYEARV